MHYTKFILIRFYSSAKHSKLELLSHHFQIVARCEFLRKFYESLRRKFEHTLRLKRFLTHCLQTGTITVHEISNTVKDECPPKPTSRLLLKSIKYTQIECGLHDNSFDYARHSRSVVLKFYHLLCNFMHSVR